MSTLTIQGTRYRYASLAPLGEQAKKLPISLRILAENLLRQKVPASEVAEAFSAEARGEKEIAFYPARVLMQDFTGVPGIVDLAAMRDAIIELGGAPEAIDPQIPTELVIDHSVQVDAFGDQQALLVNIEREYARNRERYRFLKWGQQAFHKLAVVPPGRGIVHQVNIEHLARVVFVDGDLLYPDTVVGTDSHTTMVNALGVLGWGVGGIEAEAAMLGQPIAMRVPKVVGVELVGSPREGVLATDIVLAITERLRAHGVVGKFVEFFGDGLRSLALADRATIANMAPEYGATCGLFPIDEETLAFLRLTGRTDAQLAIVKAYAQAQGLWGGADDAEFDERLRFDLSQVEPSVAGPKRPQDRIALSAMPEATKKALDAIEPGRSRSPRKAKLQLNEEACELSDGAVVIAAITSCTNTSNPALLIAAGLLAKRAAARGLRPKPWVKTSFAPGSQAVPRYLAKLGLMEALEATGFAVVGFGCTTCIGNSGPLPQAVAEAIQTHDIAAAAVLSGNRNFEGRIHPLVRLNYLASPPLVVAYALAGRVDLDFAHEPIGHDADGAPVFLRDLWPSAQEVAEAMQAVRAEDFRAAYQDLFAGDERWQALEAPSGARYAWEENSTYIRKPPFFVGMRAEPEGIAPIANARALVVLGDSVTTDHISPAGAIAEDSPAGQWLKAHGVAPSEFNSYGARRGNHEVMMRGTFANIRLRNLLVPDAEGGITLHLPDGERMSVFDAAMRYLDEGVPTIVIAGKEYGTGSSRDWAAKGPKLLGVRAVLAESFERIHRSNLVGMGIVPLEFMPGENRQTLGLSGHEAFTIEGLKEGATEVEVRTDGGKRFTMRVRVDTPKEWEYLHHGGILPYVLRRLART